MKFHQNMFLAASATVLLSLPVVSLAADNQEKDQNSGGQRNEQQQGRPQQQANPQQQAGPQQQGKPQQQAGPAGGNRTAVATRHVQQSNQWRSANSNWNSNTVWQSNPNWWRSNASFRSYTGVRVNFFYAPGFGYYSVPQEYWGRSWNAGAYLPLFFLRYAVNDYQAYGLPPPPYGCRWVWVNTSILLVDLSDGYILDEINNAW